MYLWILLTMVEKEKLAANANATLPFTRKILLFHAFGTSSSLSFRTIITKDNKLPFCLINSRCISVLVRFLLSSNLNARRNVPLKLEARN